MAERLSDILEAERALVRSDTHELGEIIEAESSQIAHESYEGEPGADAAGSEQETANSGQEALDLEEFRVHEAVGGDGRDAAEAMLAEARDAANIQQQAITDDESVDGVPTQHLIGDVAVERNTEVGGDLDVSGKACIHHDVRVEGVLNAPTIFYETLAKITWDGRHAIEFVDRGLWKTGEDYRCDRKIEEVASIYFGRWVTDRVWRWSCLWECQRDATMQEPRYDAQDWSLVAGSIEPRVEFEEKERIYDPRNFSATLTPRVWVGEMEVTNEIPMTDYAWTRKTWDSGGNERVAADEVWRISHIGIGRRLLLGPADIDNQKMRKAEFTVTVRMGVGNLSLKFEV